MAAPVVRSLTPSATKVAPGEQFTVTLDAYDPDGRKLTFTGTVTDMQGNSVPTKASVVVDELTYELVCDDPSVKVTQDPQTPGKFVVTA